MKPIRILMVVVALTGLVYGQAFEVASIREIDPATRPVGLRSTIQPNPGSLAIQNTDTEEARKAAIGGGNLIVFADALKEVGLRLDPGTVPLDVITIEKAERPSEN